MAKKKRNAGKQLPLFGIKTEGEWGTKRRGRPDGKICKITHYPHMSDIEQCATICGSHWFDKEAMRFFKTRLGSTAPAGGGAAYFTTSEKGPHGARAHSIRKYDPQACKIRTVGEFMGYKTAAQAKAAMMKLAKKPYKPKQTGLSGFLAGIFRK